MTIQAIGQISMSCGEMDIANPVRDLIMRYTHDCEDCQPLGQFLENDIYYCDQGGFDVPTVIARYGNDGPEYISGVQLATLDNRLRVALAMARAAGLISA